MHAEAAILADDADDAGVLVDREAAIESIPLQRPSLSAPLRAPSEGWPAVGSQRPLQMLKPFQAKGVKNGDAVNMALDFLLANRPTAFLAGMDVALTVPPSRPARAWSIAMGPIA